MCQASQGGLPGGGDIKAEVGSGESKKEHLAGGRGGRVLQIMEGKKGKQRVQGFCKGDHLERRQKQRSGQTILGPGASPLDGKEPMESFKGTDKGRCCAQQLNLASLCK